MKDKHFLETTLRSITHYDLEMNRLKELMKVNSDVRKDLVDSLLELCPVAVDDIFCMFHPYVRIFKVTKIGSPLVDENGLLTFHVTIKKQDKNYGFDREDYERHTLAELSTWKKIN